MSLKKSKKPVEERRMSFSNNPLNKIDQIIIEVDEQQKGVKEMNNNGAIKYDQTESAHKKLEKKTSKEADQKNLVVENIPGLRQSMQRKGAIIDEHTHKLYAQEAIVSCTLQISGLGFYG
jgi:hypothetical protein